jgi:hypothetical protein
MKELSNKNNTPEKQNYKRKLSTPKKRTSSSKARALAY